MPAINVRCNVSNPVICSTSGKAGKIRSDKRQGAVPGWLFPFGH